MKRIALVVDIKNWAFDIAANIIKKSLSDKYQIDIFACKSEEFNNDLFSVLEKVKDYDLIHFFWRVILLDFEKEEFINRVNEKYGNYDEYVEQITNKISTGIYDHLFEDDIEFNKKFTKYCKNYVVSSKELFDIYSNIDGIKKPFGIVGDSFEKELFYPMNRERFDFNNKTDNKLVIGWAGNSKWNSSLKDENGNPMDFKGFNTILKPVVEELQKENYNIELYCADKNTNPVPNDKMCEYYSKIHIYTCVSNKEGTPKPLLEAMGCAVPVITTDVGVARQALGPKGQEYILGKRIIGKNEEDIRKKLKENIIYLYNNLDILKELSEENYEYSKNYEISKMKEVYNSYFENCL